MNDIKGIFVSVRAGGVPSEVEAVKSDNGDEWQGEF